MKWNITIIFLLSCPGLIAQPLSISFEKFSLNEIGATAQLTDIVEDLNGFIWISDSEGGIHRFDGYGFESMSYDLNQPLSIPSPNVYALHVDRSNRLWAGFINTFAVLPLSNGKVEETEVVTLPNEYVSNNYIHDFLRENDSIWWVASDNGLLKFNENSKAYELFRDHTFDIGFETTRANRTYEIYQDRQKSDLLWIASGYSIKTFDKSKQEFTHIPHPKLWYEPRNALRYAAVLDFDFGLSGKIILSAAGNSGVYIYDIKLRTWEHFLYKPDGKPDTGGNQWVENVMFINDSLVFYGSATQFGYLDLLTNSLIPISAFEEMNVGRIRKLFMDSNGKLWIAGKEGILRSKQPLRHKTNDQKRTVARIKNADVSNQIHDQTYLFPESKQKVGFEIVLANPMNASEVLYRWRLEGYEDRWNYGKGKVSANYTNLKGGVYHFRHAVRIGNGDWKFGKEIQLQIEKALVERWDFRATTSLAFLFAIFQGYVLMKRYIRKRDEAILNFQRDVAKAELSSLKSQLNPSFIFNILESIHEYIRGNNTEEAADCLIKFSKLMRMVLINSKQNLVSATEEIAAIKLYVELEEVRYKQKINFSIITNNSKLSLVFLPPLVVQSFIEESIHRVVNSIPSKSKIEVEFEDLTTTNEVKITIKDSTFKQSEPAKTENQLEVFRKGVDAASLRLRSFKLLYGREAQVSTSNLKSDVDEFICIVVIRIPILSKEKLQLK